MDFTSLLCHSHALSQQGCMPESICFPDDMCCHSKAAASTVQLSQMMLCSRSWLTRQHFGSRKTSLGLIFPLCMLLLWKVTSVRYSPSHECVRALLHMHPKQQTVCGFRAADVVDFEVPKPLWYGYIAGCCGCCGSTLPCMSTC